MKKKPLDLAKRRLGFPGGSVVKNPPADAGRKTPLEKETHSNSRQPTPVFLPGKPNDAGSNQNSYGEILFLKYSYLIFFGHTTWYVGSEFPDQESNPSSLHWEHSLSHWTTVKVPNFSLKINFIEHYSLIHASYFCN